ncbi:MAG: hypothetical protein AAGA81_11895 [Acidobacteriota bacterium]
MFQVRFLAQRTDSEAQCSAAEGRAVEPECLQVALLDEGEDHHKERGEHPRAQLR